MRNVILTRLGRLFEITGNPPVGNVGDAYSYTFGTAGGSGTVTWSHTSLGSSGADFDDTTGTLSSASLANSGSYPFTLTAIDSNRQIAVASFVLVVIGASSYRLVTEPGDPIVTEGGTPMRPQ